MKLIFITVITFFLTIGAASAQHANIGIKGGLNAFTVTNKALENLKLGYHLGLIGHIHLSDQIALQPELVYSVQGAKYNAGSSEVNLNLNYLNIPVLIQYMFDNGFRIQAGPQIGILTSANTTIGNIKTNVKNDYESVDFGLTAGISYVNPKTDIGLDFRYNHGLTDVRNNSNQNAYNRGFQAGIFYLINHK